MIVTRPRVKPEPPKPEPLDASLSFDLPASLKAKVRDLAASSGTSMSEVTRRALTEYVARLTR